MKKRKPNKSDKFEKEFIAWGNRKKIFGGITLAVIILSIISIPIIIKDETMLRRFLIIWILEIIYTVMYMEGRKRIKNKR